MKNTGILVTGSHRSGSTWVGQMIALSPRVIYIHEPFNVSHRPGICNAKFDYSFTYVCDENEGSYYNAINDTIQFKYKLLAEIGALRSPRDIGRLARDYLRFKKGKFLNKSPLVKDPIAIFSVEWLVKRFTLLPIILIRHPAAFAGSVKKANWTHPFNHFLKQPLLIKYHLSKFNSQIEEYAKNKKDIVDQSILLWNLIHYMILKYRERNPDWVFIKHEAISSNPITEFGNIYKILDLPFTEDIQNKIKEFSNVKGENLKDRLLHRDSKSNILTWKERLTENEIMKIKEGTYEIAKHFYNDEDW